MYRFFIFVGFNALFRFVQTTKVTIEQVAMEETDSLVDENGRVIIITR